MNTLNSLSKKSGAKHGMHRDDALEKVNGSHVSVLRRDAINEVRAELIKELVSNGKNQILATQLVESLGVDALFKIYLKEPKQAPATYYPDEGENQPKLNSLAVMAPDYVVNNNGRIV